MNRREFLSLLAAATGAAGGGIQAAPESGRDIYPESLKAAEKTVEESLARQQPDGGLRDEYEIPQPGATAGFIRNLGAVYLAPESRFHRSADLRKRLELAAGRLLAVQHADGAIDLPTTNFGSPPDTGFVLEPVCVTARVLRERSFPETKRLESSLETFIRRAGGALVTGGIHTPNHRWVVVAALARCHQLFPDSRYVARIDQWLAEGIDLDEEGQFTERSTGVYNWVTGNALLTAGRILGRPALFEPVRKNLEAMLFFLHPNGEVATDISRRQDRFQRATTRPYYRACRFLSRHDSNGRFATLADTIEKEHSGRLGDELIYLLETPELRRDSTPRAPLPVDYEKFFPLSEFVHVRRGERSATILGRHPRFFSFRHGGAVVEAVRMATAFFGKGQFSAPLARREGGYLLEQNLEGDYLQPLEPADRRSDGNWLAMPQARRARSNVFRLRARVQIRETRNGFQLEFDIAGTERVPLAVEIALRSGGRLAGDGLASVPGQANASFLREGFATYEREGRSVRLGPGCRGHGWTQLRGAEARLEGLALCLTDFTPVKRTLEISAV